MAAWLAGTAAAQQPLPPSAGAGYVMKGPNGVDVPTNTANQVRLALVPSA